MGLIAAAPLIRPTIARNHWLTRRQALDEVFGKRAEDVVVGDLSTLLRLDPFGPQAVPSAPLRQGSAQTDHVEERAHPHQAPDRGAVVVIEVAVDGDAAGLRESEGLSDLAALEVPLL